MKRVGIAPTITPRLRAAFLAGSTLHGGWGWISYQQSPPLTGGGEIRMFLYSALVPGAGFYTYIHPLQTRAAKEICITGHNYYLLFLLSLHLHRSFSGTPFRVFLICLPHPAQVDFPQVLQVTFIHIVYPLNGSGYWIWTSDLRVMSPASTPDCSNPHGVQR